MTTSVIAGEDWEIVDGEVITIFGLEGSWHGQDMWLMSVGSDRKGYVNVWCEPNAAFPFVIAKLDRDISRSRGDAIKYLGVSNRIAVRLFLDGTIGIRHFLDATEGIDDQGDHYIDLPAVRVGEYVIPIRIYSEFVMNDNNFIATFDEDGFVI